MNDGDLAGAVDANYWQSFKLLARACGAEVLEREGMLAVSTGLPVAMLNIGFVMRPLGDPQATLKEVVSFYDEKRLPFVVRVREGVDPESETASAALGLPYSDTVPGMALYPVPPPPEPMQGLDIEQVSDSKRLRDYQRVAADGFGMPLEFVERLMGPAFLEIEGFESYLGTMDGEPVAVSSVFIDGAVAGVYNVATLQSYRRRGIGEGMTWRSVSRGREAGCAVATLQASELGKPVYERMGFRVVAPYRTFRRQDQE
jgi:ribosomal protein S18 acetylase RimI-like enzyme